MSILHVFHMSDFYKVIDEKVAKKVKRAVDSSDRLECTAFELSVSLAQNKADRHELSDMIKEKKKVQK